MYRTTAIVVIVLLPALFGCTQRSRTVERTLTLAGYTTPKEVYGERIIPVFKERWRAAHNEEVKFEESYIGSGAQARAVVGGFEADIAALSLAPDIMTLVRANLVRPSWSDGPTGGMVSRSLVVIAVRPGNPKGIKTWDDLAQPGLNVVTPSVRTSGGAMWNIAAIYGAVLRGKTKEAATKEGALGLLKKILANVNIMDKGARESLMITFEQGVGDAVITYENEVIAARNAGRRLDYVVPASTILIENPVAYVDAHATKHKNEDVAQAFVEFLMNPEAQTAFADMGYRPVLAEVEAKSQARFAPAADLFTAADLGGWNVLMNELFAPGGLYEQAVKR